MDLATVIQYSSIFFALGVIWQSAEFLAYRREYYFGGLFSWRHPLNTGAWHGRARWLAWLFEPPVWLWVLCLRLICGCLLLGTACFGFPSLGCIALLTVLIALSNYRLYRFNEASSAMALMISVSLLALVWRGDQDLVKIAVGVFISIQLTLSYFYNGIAKIQTKEWRRGDVLQVLLKWKYEVTPLGGFLSKKEKLLKVLSRGVLVFQLSFPFALFAGEYSLVWLLGGFVFHVGIVLTLGLMPFLFFFISAYPIFYYTVIGIGGVLR